MKVGTPDPDRLFFALGAIFGFLGVAAGAFGAHVLRGRISAEMLSIFETAVRDQMYHAFALMATAWAYTRWPGAATRAAGWLFVGGTVIFSGSLYLLALTGVGILGAITPIGGAAQLAGWILLSAAAMRRR